MNVYLESSALAAAFLREPGADAVEARWNSADVLVTSSITYVEVRAALAAARRARRLSATRLGRARGHLEARWAEIDRVEIDDDLIATAGDAAERFALRAGDALHLASALAVSDVTLLTLDRDLARAASGAGLGLIAV